MLFCGISAAKTTAVSALVKTYSIDIMFDNANSDQSRAAPLHVAYPRSSFIQRRTGEYGVQSVIL